jgi:methylglutaconyl-CoA hydratase
MTAAVDVEVAGGVATLTLDRPATRNALSAELVEALSEGLTRAMSDPGVRAVVLTNTGNTFCAGADLTSPGAAPTRLVEVFETILDGPKPVIGRIAGHCMGGGVGLAAACDISVVVEDAKFGFTEVRIGVAPAIISVICLAKLRPADARELFLTGRRITAARAAEVGLVTRAVGTDALDAAVAEVLDAVLAGGPNALAACKALIARVPTMARADAFAWTSKLSADLFGSDEAAAGIAAFREKRPPPWAPPPTD